MKAALLIAVALAALAPSVMAVNTTLCYVTIPLSDFVVKATGKVAVDGGKPISYKTLKGSEGTGSASLVVAWQPIANTNGSCSTTVDKKDTDLVDAWATARIIGLVSKIESTDIEGSKTTGNSAKQYSFTISGLEYAAGTGALSAKVNQKKPAPFDFATKFSDGQLTGVFGGANVTIPFTGSTGVTNKTPIKGCKLQLATKTSEVIIKCTTLRFTQISGGAADGTSGNGTAQLTKSSITFAKAPQGAVAFSAANSTTFDI